MSPHLEPTSFPCLLLLFAITLEAARILFRQRLGSRPYFTAALWAVRPWGLWAVFSIVYRVFWDLGMNNRQTFPFYFNFWVPDETWSQGFTRLVSSPPFWGWSGVLVVTSVVFLLFCRWIWGGTDDRRRVGLALVLLVFFGIMFPLIYEALPAGAEGAVDGKGSFMHVWFQSGSTMLYCMPKVKDTGDYLRRFAEIQPTLKVSLHGVSHPPGASLALYWLGKMMGATKDLYRDRPRYMLGMTLFASLSVASMYYLGLVLWGSMRLGLIAAALWVVNPAALAHNPFAPDGVYHVFFILALALIWQAGTSARRPYGRLVLLGAVLFVISMLTFSWPILCAMFGLFLLLQAWRGKWRWQELLWRGLLPAGTMAVLLGLTCAYFRLNYLTIYRFSFEYVRHFYQMSVPYQWVMALIGSQLDLYLTIGSLVGYIFWRRFGRDVRGGDITKQALYASVVLGGYLAVLLVGPNALKMESSRLWAWIAALPIAMAAGYLADLPRARTFFLGAVAFSLLQYYVMRLFVFALA